ncbi:hypothetical protein DH2020_033590 [Rehmannia glutinosa]|uniref:UBC core domain-containing protein n=1 Tax=Rehmannia glutinosa TaxID=99300 RepID=A0ABR0VF27_REHGL
MFERSGLLCRHILLLLKGEQEIPSKYLTRRWLKNASIHPFSRNGDVYQFNGGNTACVTLNKLWSDFHCCLGLAQSDTEKLSSLSRLLSEEKQKLLLEQENERSVVGKQAVIETYCGTTSGKDINILPPQQAKNKGSGSRVKSRIQSQREKAIKASTKLKRRCGEGRGCASPVESEDFPPLRTVAVGRNKEREDKARGCWGSVAWSDIAGRFVVARWTKKGVKADVICSEIIDVDMEEDCDEVMLTDVEVDTSAKGKVLQNDTVNVDDFSSNLFYGEDEWIDTYYDDILYDDYSTLQSHFDHMDIPPGVEAPFPWLPSSPRNDTKLPTASTSTHASSELQSDGVIISPGLNSSDTSWPLKHAQIVDLSTSWSNSVTDTQMDAGNQHKKGNYLLYGWNLSKRKPRASHAIYASHYNQFPPAPMYFGTVNGSGSYPTPKMPPNSLGAGSYMPVWKDLPMNVLKPSMSPSGFINDNAFTSWAQDPVNNLNGASSRATSLPTKVEIEQRNLDEVFHNFDHFKKFDTVEDYSDHHYSKNGSSEKQPPKKWAKIIQEEWKDSGKRLARMVVFLTIYSSAVAPTDEIFVRVYESRMDLLRAVIIGAEGTPYHDGLFFFDVFFPSSYPDVPPEKWIPGVSTMLQVLVSIQGLILNAKPYFNEPGYANLSGSTMGEQRSLEYNEKTFIYSLQTMVYNMRRPPKYFEDFVVGHFCKHARDILVSCKAYLDGAQVGCLVKGGVQDVDEGDKSCSQQFKASLAGFITTLVNTFSEIGAKDCEEFLSLAEKGNGLAPVAPRAPRLLNSLN